ncbi:MAG: hypothetical protein K9L76_00185 [Candidatus Omnitrophica bacterium]|nr:hypothetical protein [Candidatus Omnitrophota bacterium]
MSKALVAILIIVILAASFFAATKVFSDAAVSIKNKGYAKMLKLIPDVIWAAIIASLLTLSGVLATNRGHYQRLIKQLSHNANQQDKERRMELRRKVYLEAAEAITSNYLVINKLPNLTITDLDLSKEFSNSAASINKVNVIGSDETVKAVSELSTMISTKYLYLAAKRLPLIQRQQKINVQNNLLTKSSTEQNRMIEMMKEFNFRGARDKRLWKIINDNFEFEKDRSNKYINKINELQEKNRQEQLQFLSECLKVSKEISEYFIPAIGAVRKEMDIPFDQYAYRKHLQKSWQASQDAISKFVDKISSLN